MSCGSETYRADRRQDPALFDNVLGLIRVSKDTECHVFHRSSRTKIATLDDGAPPASAKSAEKTALSAILTCGIRGGVPPLKRRSVTCDIKSTPARSPERSTAPPCCSTLTKRFGGRGRVRVFVKGYDLAAADGVDVREVALVGAPVGFDLPDVMTEHDDLVALRDEFTRLE